MEGQIAGRSFSWSPGAISSPVTAMASAKACAVRAPRILAHSACRDRALSLSQGASVSTDIPSRGIWAATLRSGSRLGISQISGKGNQKSQVQRPPRLFPSAAEAVHHPPERRFATQCLSSTRKNRPRRRLSRWFHGMDQDRPPASGGNFKLADEPSCCTRAGRPRDNSRAESLRQAITSWSATARPVWPMRVVGLDGTVRIDSALA